jgi:imidazolonepropionase-like amidohydrolase
MKRWIAVIATAGSCLLGVGCAPGESPSGLVISDVTVISPERATPLTHAYVRLDGERIVAVSDRPLRGVTEIEGAGRYLIPGLIDSHVHLAVAPEGFPSAMTEQQAAAAPDVVATGLAQDPRSYLFFGFTTVVDLIGTAERTARWNAVELRPDAYFCGGVAVVGDHMVRVSAPIFSYPQASRIDPAALTPEQAAAGIAADKAVCVKTFYEENSPGFPPPSLAMARALVEAAHDHQLPVFIHVNRKRAQAFAVEAGVDVIVHGMWRNRGEDVALDQEAREILAAVARSKIGYQPTTQVIAGLLDMIQDDYLARPQLADAYPAALIEWYARESGGEYAQQLRSRRVALETSIRGTIERGIAVTRVLAAADAHLLFGTDTPSDAIDANPPGLNGRLEMNNWIAGGVSLEKMFRAVTIDNARAIRRDREIGTIEPGKRANLLLLGADPLQSVSAYDTIETVFLHGRPIARQTLSAREADPRSTPQ